MYCSPSRNRNRADARRQLRRDCTTLASGNGGELTAMGIDPLSPQLLTQGGRNHRPLPRAPGCIHDQRYPEKTDNRADDVETIWTETVDDDAPQ